MKLCRLLYSQIFLAGWWRLFSIAFCLPAQRDLYPCLAKSQKVKNLCWHSNVQTLLSGLFLVFSLSGMTLTFQCLQEVYNKWSSTFSYKNIQFSLWVITTLINKPVFSILFESKNRIIWHIIVTFILKKHTFEALLFYLLVESENVSNSLLCRCNKKSTHHSSSCRLYLQYVWAQACVIAFFYSPLVPFVLQKLSMLMFWFLRKEKLKVATALPCST